MSSQSSHIRLYKNKFMIAVYDVEIQTNRELECLVIVNNVKELLTYFGISITSKETIKMKDKLYRSLHNKKKNHQRMIQVNGQTFKISLIK